MNKFLEFYEKLKSSSWLKIFNFVISIMIIYYLFKQTKDLGLIKYLEILILPVNIFWLLIILILVFFNIYFYKLHFEYLLKNKFRLKYLAWQNLINHIFPFKAGEVYLLHTLGQSMESYLRGFGKYLLVKITDVLIYICFFILASLLITDSNLIRWLLVLSLLVIAIFFLYHSFYFYVWKKESSGFVVMNAKFSIIRNSIVILAFIFKMRIVVPNLDFSVYLLLASSMYLASLIPIQGLFNIGINVGMGYYFLSLYSNLDASGISAALIALITISFLTDNIVNLGVITYDYFKRKIIQSSF